MIKFDKISPITDNGLPKSSKEFWLIGLILFFIFGYFYINNIYFKIFFYFIILEKKISSAVEVSNKLRSFNIPYNKFSTDINEVLEKKERLNPLMITFLVNIIVAELRTISTDLKISTFRQVCQKLGADHPSSFNDFDSNNKMIFSNYSVLTIKMTNRNNYLNTFKDIKDKNQDILSNRKLNVLKDSCLNFDPKIILSDAEIEQSRQWLNLNYLSQVDASELKMHINLTFPEQRRLINRNEKIEVLKLNWKCLFTSFGLGQHFENLTCYIKRNVYIQIFLKQSKICEKCTLFEN